MRDHAFDFYDEGENNDIEWVESKILESKLDNASFQYRSQAKDSPIFLGCSAPAMNSTNHITDSNYSTRRVESSPSFKKTVVLNPEGIVTHTGSSRESPSPARDLPLIVTEHVEDSPKHNAEQTAAETGYKEESRDSGAESDVEMSVSETDMLVSSENDATDAGGVFERCSAVTAVPPPAVLDVTSNSARV